MVEDESKTRPHPMLSRHDCETADRDDPIAQARHAFAPGDPGTLYFDANSIGPMPLAARDAASRVLDEWRALRRRGWSESNWLAAPVRLGDKLSPLIGAAPGQVLVGDSTSINLHKALSMALALCGNRATVITQGGTFPTDLYVAQGLAASLAGMRIVRVEGDEDEIEQALHTEHANSPILYLSHTDYRTGVRLDMGRLCRTAQSARALTVWDLSHSAGGSAIALDACAADFAVGCGYKYLCGGPGAPAYLYVALRHQQAARPAPWGWMGHADQFAFAPNYRPAVGMRAHQIGTPSVLAEAVFEAALDVWAGVDLPAVWRKRDALAALLVARLRSLAPHFGVEVLTPTAPARQGGFVAFRHACAEAICASLAARHIVCSHRPPDVVRFGLSPLTHGFVDVWDACDRIEQALHGLGTATESTT